MAEQRDARTDRLWLTPEPGVRFGTFDDPDAKLVVSPAVMALLESDFPEAAREFRVDVIEEEFKRLPMRWYLGGPEPEAKPPTVWRPEAKSTVEEHEMYLVEMQKARARSRLAHEREAARQGAMRVDAFWAVAGPIAATIASLASLVLVVHIIGELAK